MKFSIFPCESEFLSVSSFSFTLSRRERAPVTGDLATVKAWKDFIFLNDYLHSACNNLFVFFSQNTYRALMALDTRHSIGRMAFGGTGLCIQWEYCWVLFHFNCWNGCGYKLLCTKGWQIMMKDTRVLSCVASSRRRKEIIAAELIT